MPFVQDLFSAANVGFGSGPYTPSGSKVITLGNRIYVAIGIPDPATNWIGSDNLGNTYSVVYELATPAGSGSNQKIVLMTAPITNAGTLTSIQVDWDTTVTCISFCSAEFSGAGAVSGIAEAASGSASTSGPVTIAAISGLLLYVITTFGQISAFTPPTGYSLADSGEVASSSGNQIFLCYKEGTAGPGTIAASWTTGRAWHAASATSALIVPENRLSFDNVFVK